MPEFRLSQLAKLLNLTLQGEDIVIRGVNTLEEANAEQLSFLANPKYVSQLADTHAGAVILRPEHASEVKNALIGTDPYPAFARCIGLFAQKEGCFEGVSPFASMHPEAVIGENCTLSPFCYVGARSEIGDNTTLFPGVYIGEDCKIGKNCILYPNSVLMSRTILGDNCVLQPGVVLGGEGFGFVPTPAGIQKIPQIGHVVLGDKVEIGANTAIDRAALSATKVGSGTAIDNLVQIGHNVVIGKDNLIVSQVGIAGSTHVGDNCIFAGQVGISGHLHIGDHVTIGPQTGVIRDIEDNKVVMGTPMSDRAQTMRIYSLTLRLPELYKRLVTVEKALAELEQKQPEHEKD